MFGERLRELRKKRKLTMKDVGAKFGLAESTISGYENNLRKPDMDTVEKIADFFEVTVDYLLGRSDSKAFTKGEENFLGDIDLPWETLKEKYNLVIDGESATEEEIMGAITWIKTNRLLSGEKKK